jgi:hypothetical protein
VTTPLMDLYDVVGGRPRSGTCTMLVGGTSTCPPIEGVGGAINRFDGWGEDSMGSPYMDDVIGWPQMWVPIEHLG